MAKTVKLNLTFSQSEWTVRNDGIYGKEGGLVKFGIYPNGEIQSGYIKLRKAKEKEDWVVVFGILFDFENGIVRFHGGEAFELSDCTIELLS